MKQENHWLLHSCMPVHTHLLLCVVCASLQGCYYWRPLGVYYPNTAPEILHSDPPLGAIMELSVSNSNNAFVVVQDIDPDDTVRFQWYISGLSLLGPGESLLQDGFVGSKLEITSASESWHNRTLTCMVYDSFNASASISWTINILEEN